MKTKIRVNRFEGRTKKPVRIGIIRGEREHAIYLDNAGVQRLRDILGLSINSGLFGFFGEILEQNEVR